MHKIGCELCTFTKFSHTCEETFMGPSLSHLRIAIAENYKNVIMSY